MKKSLIFSLVAAVALTACQTDSVSSPHAKVAQTTTEKERQDFDKLRNAAATCASIRWDAYTCTEPYESMSLPISERDQAYLREMILNRMRLIHAENEPSSFDFAITLSFLDAKGKSIFCVDKCFISSENEMKNDFTHNEKIFILSDEDYQWLSDIEPFQKIKSVFQKHYAAWEKKHYGTCY